jgi:hypothetical protein
MISRLPCPARCRKFKRGLSALERPEAAEVLVVNFGLDIVPHD